MKQIQDTNEEYHSKDSISASGLKMIAKKSVKHFLDRKFNETDAMKFGTAVHTAMLESDKFYDDYYIMPKVDGRTKEGKALKAEHIEKAKGKIVLDEADHNRIKDWRKSFARVKSRFHTMGKWMVLIFVFDLIAKIQLQDGFQM
jgi:hypothetical protein